MTVDAVDPGFVRFLLRWHGIPRRRSGDGGLQRTVAQLQGLPIPMSELESAVLGARLSDYAAPQLDELLGSGRVVWQGCRPLGQRDGLVSLFLGDDFPRLGRISALAPGSRERLLRDLLLERGGLDFDRIVAATGGFGDDILRALWKLAWNGEVTSSSLQALRARRSPAASRYHPRSRPRYTTRKRVLPGSAGVWSLLTGPASGFAPESERDLATARQLLDRFGIVWREMLAGEPAGSDALLPSFERLEARGAARRVPPPGSASAPAFAAPGVDETWRAAGDDRGGAVLAAGDPANPFGAITPWPEMVNDYRPLRSPGARVLIHDGRLVGYLARKGRGVYTPGAIRDPEVPIRVLKQAALEGPVYLELVNGDPPYRTPWHRALVAAGFSPSRRGYLLRTQR